MFKKVLLTVLTFLMCNTAMAGLVTNSPMCTADYWVNRNPEGEKIILNKAGVDDFNAKIRTKTHAVLDLSALPVTMDGADIKSTVMDYSDLDEVLYLNGVKITADYIENLKKLTNPEAIGKTIEVRYAVTVKRGDLRNLPTADWLFRDPSDFLKEYLQDTTVEPGEAVAVLHTSKDGEFYYVQMYNYRGWLSKYDVAFCNRTTWLKYVNPSKFLVVVGKDYNLPAGDNLVFHQMGARILLNDETDDSYTVTAPLRASSGKLKEITAVIVKNSSLHKGYMPYTANNVIRESFKFYANIYGWGGRFNSVDCSGLTYDVFRTMGIFLPRNSGQQRQTAGVNVPLKLLSAGQKLATINSLEPGSILFMKHHVMVYLGSVNDVPYIIHADNRILSDGVEDNYDRVVVSDLSLGVDAKRTYLDELYNAITYK